MKQSSIFFVAAVSWLMAGCNCGLTVEPEGLLCDEGNTCPAGYLCTAGVCKKSTVNACMNVTCNTPTAPQCVGAVLQTFRLPGTCTAGSCAYVMNEITCINGCANSACINQDLCMGVSCNAPPAADCQGSQVRTYVSPGTCTSGTGQCNYTSTLSNCPFGCAAGLCIAQGLSFSQVAPRLKFPLNHLDVAPGSAGNYAIAVGPRGQAAKWDGAKWSPLVTNTTHELNRVFFRNATTAYIVGSNRTFLRVDPMGVVPVAGFPAMPPGNLNLVDVHEGGQRLFVVDDAGAWWFYSFADTTWSNGNFSALNGPFQVNQLYVDSFGNARVAGHGDGGGAGFVGYYRASTNSWFEDFDDGTGGSKEPFVSVGPSYTADATNPVVFVGRNGDGHVRSHAEKMPYFGDADIPLPTSEPVTGITGNIGASLSPSLYLATLSALYRSTLVLGSSNVETLINFTLRGSDKVVMSKNDVGGVLVAEVAAFGNNVFRRGPTVDEALDLAVDYQAVTTYAAGLPLLVTQDHDVVFGLANKATYGVAKGPFFRVADAVGTANGAVTVGAAGNINRFVASTGVFTNVTGATGQLNAICRASDTDMFIVGNGGAVYRYQGGNTVITQASGTTQDLRAVDCSQGEVVACGTNGTVIRFSSGMWRSVASGLTGNFDSCRFGPNGTLYAAGDGVFSKFENNAWVSLTGDNGTQSLVVLGPTEVYALANGGKDIKRFDGQNWNTLLATQTVLRGGRQVGMKVLFVGDSGWAVEGQ